VRATSPTGPYTTDTIWVETRQRARLAAQPIAEVRVAAAVGSQDLERDNPVQPLVACAIDLSHPAGAERTFDAVGTESRTRAKARIISK
jgi:hypothetical protein